ncbi:c-type cytochrome biogenesis protein CcmI [Aestuariivirga sp.]|jgi:cytochrome c-type biogenesis protein CcmH|uniref:c-type cytochrome biogenesis protein CcmI n=1 Tax=Aestuariivirga sp. TaxID=2650926 RepID=UPI00378444C4
MIWFVLAAMTAAVLAALLFPAIREGRAEARADRNACDRAVFRDQLAELERDVARGLIGPAEAEAARNEISRRLIAVAGAEPERRAGRAAQVVAVAAAVLVPLVAVPLYLSSGNPGMPDVPLAQRMAAAEDAGDFDALIVKVERHLAQNPDDLEGWKVLGPAYRRGQRWADLVVAERNILRLSPPSAAQLADYGEALVLAGEGMVSAEAHAEFKKALALDAGLPKARFYDALALKQEGRTDEARAAFEAFLADTPADAPWRPMLTAELQDMNAKPPALDQQTIEDAAAMSGDDQQAMIRSMVDGLEEKLKANPDDLPGWLRLIRARAVLGDADKAKAAYESALRQYSGNEDALAQIASLGREMKIQ